MEQYLAKMKKWTKTTDESIKRYRTTVARVFEQYSKVSFNETTSPNLLQLFIASSRYASISQF